jgi:hypothetical protein
VPSLMRIVPDPIAFCILFLPGIYTAHRVL